MIKKSVLLSVVLALVFGKAIFAQEEGDAAAAETTASEGTYPPPPPKGLEKKRPVIKDKYDKKKESWFLTGLPLLNSDPDKGVGYGARVYYYNNGAKDSEHFAYTPYRHRVYAQFFQTTNGFQFHEVNYDSPYIADSLWRLQAIVAYQKNTNEQYFGYGSSNRKTLRNPTTGESYDTYKDYNDDLRTKSAGNTNAFYNFYEFEEPAITVAGQRDWFGSQVRTLFGFRFQDRTINDYSGDTVEFDDKKATQSNTQLFNDAAAKRISGFGGGSTNALTLGIAYDTRDFEPDPTSGVFIEGVTDFVGSYTGADYDFVKFTFSPKWYWSPFIKGNHAFKRFTIASRLVYSLVSTEDAPFWEYNKITNTSYSNNTGYLGGLRSMRGFKPNRFSGQSLNMVNIETRWTMFDVGPWGGQRFAFILVPFIDIGQANEEITVGVDELELSYGAGLRIAWNQGTIIMVDYALSREGGNLYINFNHIF